MLFFKQKTAYEMRISDWSSDVCSSDLPLKGFRRLHLHAHIIRTTSCGDRSTAGTADMAAALARLASGVWLRPCLTDDPALPRTPVIAAWGMGLDSTAMIIEWVARGRPLDLRSEEHTSELQSLMRISYAVFCLKK